MFDLVRISTSNTNQSIVGLWYTCILTSTMNKMLITVYFSGTHLRLMSNKPEHSVYFTLETVMHKVYHPIFLKPSKNSKTCFAAYNISYHCTNLAKHQQNLCLCFNVVCHGVCIFAQIGSKTSTFVQMKPYWTACSVSLRYSREQNNPWLLMVSIWSTLALIFETQLKNCIWLFWHCTIGTSTTLLLIWN